MLSGGMGLIIHMHSWSHDCIMRSSDSVEVRGRDWGNIAMLTKKGNQLRYDSHPEFAPFSQTPRYIEAQGSYTEAGKRMWSRGGAWGFVCYRFHRCDSDSISPAPSLPCSLDHASWASPYTTSDV